MSIASQLQAIRSVLGAPEPVGRPQTRPSITFDPRKAADIDLRTILRIALSKLEHLICLDGRFGGFKDTLFRESTLEVDREKMTPKEEEKLNKSIISYLRLLSGHFQHGAALETLEYLVRRYLIHTYNVDELVLCALPYHDTHAFVRIVQLLDLGNKKWSFLEGVKASGAPPPRKIIVQQCIRDKGLLETVCNYASPVKDFQHSRPVIFFCTGIIVETLGAIPMLDTDTVQRVLGFVFNGLNPATGGSRDHKAGAFMVIGLLSTKATLTSKLFQNLIFFIARVAQKDANLSVDLPWLRVTIMALVTLVQSQSKQVFPKKTVFMLLAVRDFTGVLLELCKEFNVQPFLNLYLESLVEHSMFENSCLDAVCNMIKVLPYKDMIHNLVSKVLANFIKMSRGNSTKLLESGKWAKKILEAINELYPSEVRREFHKFLENPKVDQKEEQTVLETLYGTLGGDCDMSFEISNSKAWFSLEHPKAAVRRSSLLSIASPEFLKAMAFDPQRLLNVKDAITRALHDEDLTVVQAALSIDGLDRIVNPPCLLKIYHDILSRCSDAINKNLFNTIQASNLAISCLEHMVLKFQLQNKNYSREIATIVFPLLLVLPKTWRMNLKALELVKQVNWPFYSESCIAYHRNGEIKNLEPDHATSINIKTIEALAEMLMTKPEEHLPWLIECSNDNKISKSLFFFIILQASIKHNRDLRLLELLQTCFLSLKKEWHGLQLSGGPDLAEEINVGELDKCYVGLVKSLLFSSDIDILNSNLLISIFWGLLKAFSEKVNQNSLGDNEHGAFLQEMFLFFVTSPSRSYLKSHLDFLVTTCSGAPFQFLLKYITEEGFPVEVQVESLRLFATLCSVYTSSERSNLEESSDLHLLLGFPSLLVPLASHNKDVRVSAMECVEALYKLWCRFDVSRLKNGNDTILSRSVSSPTFGYFLEILVHQKKLIGSDVNFLSSFLASILGSSTDNLLVPNNADRRFEQPAKDAILFFLLTSVLKFSSYGKLMALSLLKGVGSALLRVEGVKSLLFDLLGRHRQSTGHGQLLQKLSKNEIATLCLILEGTKETYSSVVKMLNAQLESLPFFFYDTFSPRNTDTFAIKACIPVSNSTHVDGDIIKCLLGALRVDGLSLDDAAVVKPCVTVLKSLTPTFYNNLRVENQDEIFGSLVSLYRNDIGEIRNAARETFLRIDVSCLTVVRFLEFLLAKGHEIDSTKRMKKNCSSHHNFSLCQGPCNEEESRFPALFSILDILLLKKNVDDRIPLVKPLFEVLAQLFSNDKVFDLVNLKEKDGTLPNVSESTSGVICQAQHMTLLILKDIIDSLVPNAAGNDGIFSDGDMRLLVKLAHSAKDVATRNHVLLLLSSIAKVSLGWISEHIIEIFNMIGESAIIQNDSHSQHVLEELISTLVPCWLLKTRSIDKLLKIFIQSLPVIGEHRRLTLIVYLLRTLGEESSLGIFIVQLLCSLVQRINKSSEDKSRSDDFSYSSSSMLKQWEYSFALQSCNQYSCKLWLPCLVKVLREIGKNNEMKGFALQMYVAMQFVLQILEDPELAFELESGQDAEYLQITLGELLEQVVLHLQLIRSKSESHRTSRDAQKELTACGNTILKVITNWMIPSTFFMSISKLLGHTDGNVKKKTLGLLCDTIRDHALVQKKNKETRKMKHKLRQFSLDVDNSAKPSFYEMCSKVVQLIDNSDMDGVNLSVKFAAISSVELLSIEFPSESMIFDTCLATVCKFILSNDFAVSSGCIQASGALVSVLGSRALSHLPHVMKHIIKRCHEISGCHIVQSEHVNDGIDNDVSSVRGSVILSILNTLEAIIDKLGGFLNPYLEEILDIILLQPEFVLQSDMKIKAKAYAVQKLLTGKIPVRLLLTPLLKTYTKSLECGEVSISLVFQLLTSLIVTMDRASMGTYHVKIFEQCLMALDIRRQNPSIVKNINMVEQSVIHAMVALTMRLTETMFRPLFLHCLEWAESEIEENGTRSKSLDHMISFYKLVNNLIEQHRSLFVPYFKYLLESCIRCLTESEDMVLPPRRKKSKVGEKHSRRKDNALSLKQWHLRAFILRSLYQCFLYDTDLKIVESNNFQVLLKPIILQLVAEPPSSLEHSREVPTVEEVDESLILCLGQMAVTARSDVLLKPLNHEVLMQTRNEKTRPRIVGLKVIKYLVEHLKEEYLVFLPETIPFLGELLEDVELPVKALAQEILKELETLSGESLGQYL